MIGIAGTSQTFALAGGWSVFYYAPGANGRHEMKHLSVCCAIFVAALAVPAGAALQEGAKAPAFSAQASMGGQEFSLSLADALKKGPVALYFYRAAFTPWSTQDAPDVAE